MMAKVMIEPQPELIHGTVDMWAFELAGHELQVGNMDVLKSYLFHEIYGNSLANSTVLEECEPMLIDGVWYWVQLDGDDTEQGE